jgi:hypothetical protein
MNSKNNFYMHTERSVWGTYAESVQCQMARLPFSELMVRCMQIKVNTIRLVVPAPKLPHVGASAQAVRTALFLPLRLDEVVYSSRCPPIAIFFCS